MKFGKYTQLCTIFSYIAVFFYNKSVSMGAPYQHLDNKKLLQQCRDENRLFLETINLSVRSIISAQTHKAQSPTQTVYTLDETKRHQLEERMSYTNTLLQHVAESPKQQHIKELVQQHAVLEQIYKKSFEERICYPGNNPAISVVDLED